MRLRCGTTGGPGGGYSRIPEDHYDSQRGHTHLPKHETPYPKHTIWKLPQNTKIAVISHGTSTNPKILIHAQKSPDTLPTTNHSRQHTHILTHKDTDTHNHTHTQPTHTILQHSTYIIIMKTDPHKTHKLTTPISPTPDLLISHFPIQDWTTTQPSPPGVAGQGIVL